MWFNKTIAKTEVHKNIQDNFQNLVVITNGSTELRTTFSYAFMEKQYGLNL